MKKIVQKCSFLLVSLLMMCALSVSLQPLGVYAQNLPNSSSAGANDLGSNCTQSFLTLPAWYNGLLDSDCEVKSPTEVGGFTQFVTKIGLNVVEMILRLSGYASVAFIIYGGYKYMISAGSPDGMVGARKTIMNAVIGLIISIAAVAIVNTIAKGI